MPTLDKIVTQFVQGEWVFCEFELHQITKVTEDGRITDVSNGWFFHGSYDLRDRCLPMTLRTKRISDSYASASKRIHDRGSSGLNFPDIHRWLVAHWIATCDLPDEKLTEAFAELTAFERAMISAGDVDSGYGFSTFQKRSK